jgi:hypothetical protein
MPSSCCSSAQRRVQYKKSEIVFVPSVELCISKVQGELELQLSASFKVTKDMSVVWLFRLVSEEPDSGARFNFCGFGMSAFRQPWQHKYDCPRALSLHLVDNKSCTAKFTTPNSHNHHTTI